MNFYVMLSNLYDKYKIPPERRFNCDEKGHQIGVTGNEKVLVMRRDPGVKQDGNAAGSHETVTTIETISAQGVMLPLFIIMKGKNVQKRWCKNSPLPLTTVWATSPKGWTNNELGVEYIKAFDGWTKELSVNGQWQCLILDGHGSHLTYEFLKYAMDA
ncbi:hypothetical protein FS749_006670 [Ceratobasidium sp. UAMH 11750]|nr:hypothetical protein FS749_006670 [Ceratobasidium sp. UAMH 11750]